MFTSSTHHDGSSNPYGPVVIPTAPPSLEEPASVQKKVKETFFEAFKRIVDLSIKTPHKDGLVCGAVTTILGIATPFVAGPVGLLAAVPLTFCGIREVAKTLKASTLEVTDVQQDAQAQVVFIQNLQRDNAIMVAQLEKMIRAVNKEIIKAQSDSENPANFQKVSDDLKQVSALVQQVKSKSDNQAQVMPLIQEKLANIHADCAHLPSISNLVGALIGAAVMGPLGGAVGAGIGHIVNEHGKPMVEALFGKEPDPMPAIPNRDTPVTHAFNHRSTGVVGRYLLGRESGTVGQLSILVNPDLLVHSISKLDEEIKYPIMTVSFNLNAAQPISVRDMEWIREDLQAQLNNHSTHEVATNIIKVIRALTRPKAVIETPNRKENKFVPLISAEDKTVYFGELESAAKLQMQSIKSKSSAMEETTGKHVPHLVKQFETKTPSHTAPVTQNPIPKVPENTNPQKKTPELPKQQKPTGVAPTGVVSKNATAVPPKHAVTPKNTGVALPKPLVKVSNDDEEWEDE
jgi:hypothetical protein